MTPTEWAKQLRESLTPEQVEWLEYSIEIEAVLLRSMPWSRRPRPPIASA
jgi:hypothetical protein